jgi:hypothetical protein
MTDMKILLDTGLVKNKQESNYVLASQLLIMPGLPSEPIPLEKVGGTMLITAAHVRDSSVPTYPPQNAACLVTGSVDPHHERFL